MIFNIVILFCVTFYCFLGDIYANKAPLAEVSLDSGMVIQPYTNRGIGLFTLHNQDLLSSLYWRFDQRISMIYKPAGVFVRGFLTGLLQNQYHLGELYRIAYHELGHGTRAEAFGYRVMYSTSETEHVDSYYELLFDLLQYSTAITGAWAHYYDDLNVHDSVDASDESLILSAGGVNNEMYLAQLIENRFYDRRVTSVYDFYHYLSAKLAVDNYVSYEQDDPDFMGDLYRVKQRYKTKDIDITYPELKRYNGYAILLSSSFWAFLDGWSRYVVKGIDYIEYYEKFGFRLPDINFFLTSHGPSYHIQSGYRFADNTTVPFAVEYVFIGDQQIEYTMGLKRRWTDHCLTQSEIRLGESVGLSQSFRYLLSSKLDMTLGLDLQQFKNLYGERHIKTLADGNHDLDIWFNVRFVL
ncbi:hypothetical protein CL647_04935 [bacterium]|nr:hypothetical protein [bacterium]